VDLADTAINVNSVCPGYCATDLNEFKGTKTAAQGAVIVVTMATLPADGPSGDFFNDNGTYYPMVNHRIFHVRSSFELPAGCRVLSKTLLHSGVIIASDMFEVFCSY